MRTSSLPRKSSAQIGQPDGALFEVEFFLICDSFDFNSTWTEDVGVPELLGALSSWC